MIGFCKQSLIEYQALCGFSHSAYYEQKVCFIKVLYLSKLSQDKYIELLGTATECRMINEISHGQFISIMIGSTPYSSHSETYSIVVRYTDNYQVKERYFHYKN